MYGLGEKGGRSRIVKIITSSVSLGVHPLGRNTENSQRKDIQSATWRKASAMPPVDEVFSKAHKDSMYMSLVMKYGGSL